MEEAPLEIQEIVLAAAAAPSGDNSQPWHFVFRAPTTLEFHYHPEKDNPLLNVNEGGTLIALGAAIENATLEAKAKGFLVQTKLHPEKDGSHVATMELSPGGEISPEDSMLQSVIFLRHSNRKAYKKDSLKPEDRKAFLLQGESIPGLSIKLLEDRKKMELFSQNLTVMEEVALANKTLHRLFFADIFWSNSKHYSGEPGLHGKTLELPPPAQALFRILRYWPVAGFLARIRFPRFVAKTNALQNEASAAFGAIVSSNLGAQTYMEAGRLLERLWLQATASGLSFQIVTGVLFLSRSIETGKAAGVFSEHEQQAARAATASMHELLEMGSKHPVITFRIGYGSPATRRSLRMKPRIEVVH